MKGGCLGSLELRMRCFGRCFGYVGLFFFYAFVLVVRGNGIVFCDGGCFEAVENVGDG